MKEMATLFGEHLTATLVVAFASFLLGLVVEMLVVRFTRRGAQQAGDASRRQAQRGGSRANDVLKFEKRHPAPADGSIEIYVGNLSYDMTEDALRKEFEAFGKVNYARIITNRINGRSKGFGFIHMPNRAEVDAAIRALDDKEILGRRIKCNEAKNAV